MNYLDPRPVCSGQTLLEEDFETMIIGFIENKVGISEHFINKALSGHLKTNLLALWQQKKFLAAGTGNTQNRVHNNEVRGDSIYWLDRKHEDPYENEFFDRVEDFIKYLNISCYAGITGYEFHYSLYETGSFYKKHLDQFHNNSDRKYSMISYLNENWAEADGGQLMIHQSDNDQKIDPTNGKTVFFKSDELVHEVLVTNERRLSVTGWLKGA